MPKTGAHLPAALVHDALVAGGGEPSYDSTEGHVIDRVQADRVFRDAMADTGTGVVRRWIVWSAVTAATIFVRGGLPSRRVVARCCGGRTGSAPGCRSRSILYLGYCVDRRPVRPDVAAGVVGAVDGGPALVAGAARRALRGRGASRWC